MLEAGHLEHAVFDHLTCLWIPPRWHKKIMRVPAPAECRVWGRPWPVGGDCCLWTGHNNGKKNGRVHGKVRHKINGVWRTVYIHRYALACHQGVDIGTFDNVDHLCRNSTCFNPFHLEDIDGKTNTDRGNGVIYQFKTKDQQGESTLSDEDLEALASGYIGVSRR